MPIKLGKMSVSGQNIFTLGQLRGSCSLWWIFWILIIEPPNLQSAGAETARPLGRVALAGTPKEYLGWMKQAECAFLTWTNTSPSTTRFVSILLHEVTPPEHHQGSTGPRLDLFFPSKEDLHRHRLLVCITLQTTFFTSGKLKFPVFFFSKWWLSLRN